MKTNWDRINHLANEIVKAADDYYNKTPSMSDAAYDKLVAELTERCPTHPVLKRVGAPVATTSRLTKVKHHIPMGSLAKADTPEEFQAWYVKTGAAYFSVQEKLDGISVEVEYAAGKFVRASTRGDGEVGEDITHTVRFMGNVPMNLPVAFSGYLRGEIILPRSRFEKFFSGGDYANPRNTVSGLVRRKQVDARVVHFQVRYFDMLCENLLFATEAAKLAYMVQELKVAVVEYTTGDAADVHSRYSYYCDGARAKCDYDLDGLVVKVDNQVEQRKLGEVAGRPRGQVAWKFPSQAATTILRRVEWQVGVTGRVTPVAVLDPTPLVGVTIERASLHNVSYIKRLGLTALPAQVVIRRFGDVIPGVEQVVQVGKRPLEVPEFCPVCQATLEFAGEHLVCLSVRCPAKVRGDLTRWIEVLDIQGLGDSFVEAVTDPKFVKPVWSPAHLYRLSLEDLLSIPGYQLAKAKKAFEAINRVKRIPLAQFMAGLNIPEVGRATWDSIIAAGYGTVEKLAALTEEELVNISGIADKTAQLVVAGIRTKSKVAGALIRNGVVPEEPRTGPLTGLSFCFTGSLPSGMSRPVAQKIVQHQGGTVKNSVSKGLTYLVQANKKSTSTKTQKANKYGVKIIDEEDFLNISQFDLALLEKLR